MGLLDTLNTLISNKERSLRNILSLLFVVALEALITTEKFFDCPSKNNATYGWMFIFAPAIVLAFLSVMLSEDFWKITQGICYHRAPRRKGKKMLSLCLRWNCKGTSFVVVLYNGLAAACLWLFWAFLQGRYYMCAKEGNKDYMLQHAGNKTEVNRINQIFEQAKTESQHIGFYIILVVVIVPSIMLSIYRCVYQRAFLSKKIKDPEEFYEIEATQAIATFNKKFTERAEEIGKKKAEKFFQDQKHEESSYPLVEQAYEAMVSQPYVNLENNTQAAEEEEMQTSATVL